MKKLKLSIFALAILFAMPAAVSAQKVGETFHFENEWGKRLFESDNGKTLIIEADSIFNVELTSQNDSLELYPVYDSTSFEFLGRRTHTERGTYTDMWVFRATRSNVESTFGIRGYKPGIDDGIFIATIYTK